MELTVGLDHFVRRGFPLWNTVTAQGPTVSVAALFVIPLFTLAVNENSPLPLRLVTEGVSQLWLEETVHPQLESVVLTMTTPLPPEEPRLNAEGVTP